MYLLNSYIKIAKTFIVYICYSKLFSPVFYANAQVILKMSLSNSCMFKIKIYKSILPLLPEREKSHLKRPKWLVSAILFRCYQRHLSGAPFGIWFQSLHIQSLRNGYTKTVHYASHYFNFHPVRPLIEGHREQENACN